MSISRDKIIKPIKSGGLIVYFLFNACFFIGITAQSSGIASYKTASAGTYTMAEAAYVTSLWTQAIATVGGWIALNLFFGVCILANRITRLHEAYLSSFPASPDVTPDSAAPRYGNHSTAGVIKRDQYSDREYTVHGDGVVVSRISGDAYTWRNEGEFRDWSDRQPAS